MRISPDFFTTLGTGPVMGRSFEEAETITPIENHGAAILTDASGARSSLRYRTCSAGKFA